MHASREVAIKAPRSTTMSLMAPTALAGKSRSQTRSNVSERATEGVYVVPLSSGQLYLPIPEGVGVEKLVLDAVVELARDVVVEAGAVEVLFSFSSAWGYPALFKVTGATYLTGGGT